MKIILSRKGFDSSSGGHPSPIFEDGYMQSLPIPDTRSPVSFEDIKYRHGNLGSLVSLLSRKKIPETSGAHLDPDLEITSIARKKGWRPIFGQHGAAQGHLNNNGVGEGDLFLFFGLFRNIKIKDGHFCWQKKSKPRHVLWGWMQVDEVFDPQKMQASEYAWAHYHPHFHICTEKNNRIYIGREILELNGAAATSISGAGCFNYFEPSLQLSKNKAKNPSIWMLPEWCFPERGHTPFTYHSRAERWVKSDDHVQLRSVARGQEYILDTEVYPEAIEWALNLIMKAKKIKK